MSVWFCDLHRTWTRGDCPKCDDDQIADLERCAKTTPINLAGRRERAPQSADGPPAITFTMDDDRIIFRDQAALDDYLAGAREEAWIVLSADDTAAINAARAEAWGEAAEAVSDWMWNNPSPSGIPSDPPRNPYEAQS